MKSHVTIMKHKCIICTKDFEGGIALDTRLRERFEMYTECGWGVCDECQELTKDRIALIVIDPHKSEIKYGSNRIQPEDAYRTGSIQFLQKEAARQIFKNGDDIVKSRFMFIDEGVEKQIKLIAEKVKNDTTGESGGNQGSDTNVHQEP